VAGIEYVPPSKHLLNVLDPVGNGTAKDKRLDPTPVDQLVAVSCSVFRINLNCALQIFFSC